MYTWSWSKPERGYPERTPRKNNEEKSGYHRENREKQVSSMDGEKSEPVFSKKKRDETAERLSERQHIPQISRNPFLEMLNKCEGEGHIQMYIRDLSQQDEFMRPRDSNVK